MKPAPATPAAHGQPPNVLLIADDRPFCALVGDYLTSFGYHVEAAHTGPAGVERAIGGEPWQAVILDVMLPGMDGFEVLKHIRKQSDVPVLMLTARGDEADQIARLEVALSILENQANLNGHRRYAERALDEVHHLSDIVQDLLSFTKAGRREKGAALQSVSLAGIAAKAVHREAAEGWVIVTVDETLQVCAEPDLLVRALANAIHNAVRYAGSAGPITLSAEPVRDHGGDELVNLLVADQGPGVPLESLDRLFDPFYRPEDARTRETGGNGLGLAIVKSCVKACGGRVSVRNRVPHGLELTFTLHRA